MYAALEGGSRLEFTKRHVRASDTQTAAVCCAEKEQNIPLNLLETLSAFFLPPSLSQGAWRAATPLKCE